MDDLTPFEGRFEARVRAFASSGVQSVDSTAIARAVAQSHPRGDAARPTLRRPGAAFQRTRLKALLAAAAALAVVLGGTLLVLNRPGPAILVPSPTLVPSVLQPTETPPIEASPTPFVQSLDLIWTEVDPLNAEQVAWLGDRFGVVDHDSGSVSTSADGVSWQALQPGDPYPGNHRGTFATWEDDVVGWWNPIPKGPDIAGATPPPFLRDVVRTLRPPAAPVEATPFDGPIGSIGIGPLGLVAHVHSRLDWDAWVATKLGEDWVSHLTGVTFEDGVLDIGVDNGPGLHVVWAEEGFELGDYQDRGFGWFSTDGEQWTAIPGFPADVLEVVGVSDGFMADTLGGMWHSEDGMTWRNLGDREGGDGSVLPWMGDVLVTDGVRRFDLWTAGGPSALPMAAEVPAPANSYAAFGGGPLGLVSLDIIEHEILFTRDGVDWKIQPMPAELIGDVDASRFQTVAVGDRSVLVLLIRREGDLQVPVPSLWLGTPEQ